MSQLAPRIHLASRSPRRRELLTQIGIQFDTMIFRDGARADKETDETPLPGEDPVAYVQRVARAKAEHGWRCVGWRKRMATSASRMERSSSRSSSSSVTLICG